MARLFAGPDDKRIKRALCIVAHPDDIEFYCAGVVLMMARHGVVVDFVLATSSRVFRQTSLNFPAAMVFIHRL